MPVVLFKKSVLFIKVLNSTFEKENGENKMKSRRSGVLHLSHFLVSYLRMYCNYLDAYSWNICFVVLMYSILKILSEPVSVLYR